MQLLEYLKTLCQMSPPVPGSQYLPPPGSAPSLECHVSPVDVEFLEEVADLQIKVGMEPVQYMHSIQVKSYIMQDATFVSVYIAFLLKPDPSSSSSCRISPYNAKEGSFEVCLGLLKSEIFTISPIRVSNNWSAIILAL